MNAMRLAGGAVGGLCLLWGVLLIVAGAVEGELDATGWIFGIVLAILGAVLLAYVIRGEPNRR